MTVASYLPRGCVHEGEVPQLGIQDKAHIERDLDSEQLR